MVRNNPERPVQALVAICSLVFVLLVVAAFAGSNSQPEPGAAETAKADTGTH